ncbi:hypothetical protein G8A07_13030 [Roseateles sp. DAIF2]|uniref:hypothetical protein n=1 Tax=Roseateles sp. DAIF2 TaxID=2714952 RepID=UPI0018A2D4CD|nr:hypothetical protein [Roseateles sp. DAIF2]QPF73756.1 hypothetical protein G8A07_13030 [Roseateles sp. DAIF2]
METLTLREIPDFLPPWSYASAGSDRRGHAQRVAARRAFIELKLGFTRAAAAVPGPDGADLQSQVRHASEPIELWLLRGRLLAALPDETAEIQARELALAMAGVDRLGAQRLPR